MLAIYAYPSDIRDAALGVIIPPDADVALERLIAKATERIRNAVPGVDTRVSTGALSADTVRGVIEDMVLRVARNPNGYRQVSLDDYVRMLDKAISSGKLYLADDERDLLMTKSASPSTRPSRIGSMRLAVPAYRLPGG